MSVEAAAAATGSAATGFILHPNAAQQGDEGRFTSMSLTRNAGAVIVEERRARAVRNPASLCVDDIAGARPRSLPQHARASLGTLDVEGAQPKVLHRLISYTPEVVEGASWGPRHLRVVFFLPLSLSRPASFHTHLTCGRLCPSRHKVPHGAADGPCCPWALWPAARARAARRCAALQARPGPAQ